MKFLIKIFMIFHLHILSIFANQEIDKVEEAINKFPEVNLPFKFSDGYENKNINSKTDYLINGDTLNLYSALEIFSCNNVLKLKKPPPNPLKEGELA